MSQKSPLPQGDTIQERYIDYCEITGREPIGALRFFDADSFEIPYNNMRPSNLTATELYRRIPYHFRKHEGYLGREFEYTFKHDGMCHFNFK